jgi:hypothetical protein
MDESMTQEGSWAWLHGPQTAQKHQSPEGRLRGKPRTQLPLLPALRQPS